MNTLFPIDLKYPEGFQYTADFISEAEEAFLLEELSKIERHAFAFQGYEAKRKVASFGWDWSFEHKRLSKGKDIPELFHPLIEKVATQVSLAKEVFAELLVTEYPVGSVINWHRDAPPFDVIAGISLQCDCIFRLRPYDKIKQRRNTIVSLPVKARSLNVLQGPARTDWQHSIAAVDQVRYSITLRTLKDIPQIQYKVGAFTQHLAYPAPRLWCIRLPVRLPLR
jgi:alkylated DNA repair dioxygenase AlkB